MRIITWRRAALAVCAVALVGAGIWFLVREADPYRSEARKAWKDKAIVTIERLLADRATIDTERAKVERRVAAQNIEGNWLGNNVRVMQNGDWIVCQSICTKEKTPVTRDLFVGFGSDGRWYYSTFHFCVGYATLMMEPQPASLAAFIDGFYLVPFDGRSDDALNVTWEHGPYGSMKLQGQAPATE